MHKSYRCLHVGCDWHGLYCPSALYRPLNPSPAQDHANETGHFSYAWEPAS